MRGLNILNLMTGLCIAPALAFSCGYAGAASLAPVLTERGLMISLKGDITREDANVLEILIGTANAGGKIIAGLQLDSFGGNLIGGMRLARLVRTQGDLSTVVSYGATCTSACFLVFAAGREKFADYTSSVGVHAASDPVGGMTDETAAATRAMAHFCEQLGVPFAITDKLVTTPPGEITWLTLQDFQSMGVTMTGYPSQSSLKTNTSKFLKSEVHLQPPQALSGDIEPQRLP